MTDQTPPPTTSTPDKIDPKKTSTVLYVICALVILLSITSLSASAWLYTQLQKETSHPDPTHQLDTLTQTLTTLQHAQTQTQKQFEHIHQSIQTQASTLENLNLQILQLKARWQAAFKTTHIERQIHQLAAALNDTQRHLLMTHSLQQAKLLLSDAEKLCLSIQSGAIEVVCLAIHEDLQRLSHHQKLDLSHTLKALDTLHTKLTQTLFQKRPPQNNDGNTLEYTDANTAARPTDSTYQSIPHSATAQLNLAWQRLLDFFQTHIVKVHRVEPNSLIKLSHDEFQALNQQLVLIFQQARTAVVLKDQVLFNTTLSELKRFTQQHAKDLESVAPVITETLATLSKTSIETPNLISLKASELLNQIKQSMHSSD